MSADAAEKAMRSSAAGSRVRELAEKQKLHIEKKRAASPAEDGAGAPATAGAGAAPSPF